MKSCVITGSLLGWLSAFLKDRFQRVKLNDVFSEWKRVTSGVPQGSCLGPTLFLIFINDLISVVKHCKIFLYADDCKLYLCFAKNDNMDLMKRDLSNVLEWLNKWLLKANESKCFVVHFGFGNPRKEYKLGTTVIQSTVNFKDLGVLFSDNMSFSAHIRGIVNKASKVANAIHRSIVNRNAVFLMKMFRAHVIPVLEYCSEVWNPFLKKDIHLLESVQRRFTKRIPSLRDNSYSERCVILKLPTLEYRRLLNDLVITYKIMNGLTVINPYTFFSFQTYGSLRGHDKKIKPDMSSKQFRFKFFANRVVRPWNSLSQATIDSKNAELFRINCNAEKRSLSSFLLCYS